MVELLGFLGTPKLLGCVVLADKRTGDEVFAGGA